ncbi:MAG: ATP-binding protein [Polaromonas sp.]|uniref:ATP-binding protein n=1 Tax=Polaromonas sp. TaxID=1869339 RepID=UPI0027321836|nr:ATP-binding protein [Polaromonas sp.]MDP2255021.1 ATP-binding protein [Polaromonas sp.]
MWSRFTSHLYVRIWLAVVATVAVLTFLVGAAWHFSADPPQLPIREVLVHNAAGDVIGKAQTRPDRKRGEDIEFQVLTTDGQTLSLLLPRPTRPPGGALNRPPFGFSFGWMLVLVGLAVALGAYPVMRRLTLRLEALQRGVERWGAGDLSARINTEGHDEVAFLARRFNHAAERIETLMESHKSLLANASHELRSPLARIRMGLELMDHQAPTLATVCASLPTEEAHFSRGGPPENSQGLKRSPAVMEEIYRSINELDQLIDEILLASRLDTKQADAEPFETLDLTGLAAEECARVNAELNAELPAETGRGTAPTGHSLMVRGSPRLLRRLIRNLLENARRYGRGDISLALAQIRSGPKPFAVIRVLDRGPGVPAAQRERIFEPFYRLPGASEREGGVGLGLSLVKSISERHGGTVRCEDRPGGGASFIVELPMTAPTT